MLVWYALHADHVPVTAVLAATPEAARSAIFLKLIKLPDRQQDLSRWIRDGRILLEYSPASGNSRLFPSTRHA